MSNTGRKNAPPPPRQQVRDNLRSHTNLYAQFIKPTNEFLSSFNVPLVPQQAKTISKLSTRAESGDLTSTNAMTQSSMGFFKNGFSQLFKGNFSTGLTHISGGFAEGAASKIIADNEGAQGKLDPIAQMKYDDDLMNN